MIKEVQPTKHKYDADLTWSAHTDTFRPTLDGHGIDFEINAFKHNLNGTMLLNHQTDKIYEDEIKNIRYWRIRRWCLFSCCRRTTTTSGLVD